MIRQCERGNSLRSRKPRQRFRERPSRRNNRNAHAGRSSGASLFGLQLAQRIHERVNIPKLSVYRRKPDIGDLVELAELFHRQFADLFTRTSWLISFDMAYSISLAARSRSTSDTGRFSQARSRPRSSLSRSNACRDPSFFTTMMGSVSITSYVVNRFWHCRHSPAPANPLAVVSRPGIHDLALFISAKRTSHPGSLPCCVYCILP